MNRKTTIWIKFMMKFYGIEGQLDEYKEKEMNRIGSNAFLLVSVYNLISTGICFFSFDQLGRIQIVILVTLNMIVYFFALPLYIGAAVKLSGLTEIDMDEKEYPRAKQKLIFQSIRSIFTYGIGMFFFEAIIKFSFDGVPVKSSLLDISNLIVWLLLGVFINIVTYIIRVKAMKQAVKKSREL